MNNRYVQLKNQFGDASSLVRVVHVFRLSVSTDCEISPTLKCMIIQTREVFVAIKKQANGFWPVFAANMHPGSLLNKRYKLYGEKTGPKPLDVTARCLLSCD
jgi:hypothetical protein